MAKLRWSIGGLACALSIAGCTSQQSGAATTTAPSVAPDASADSGPADSESPDGASPVAEPIGPPISCGYPSGQNLVDLELDSTIVVTATMSAGPGGSPRPIPSLGLSYDALNYVTKISDVQVIARAADGPAAVPTELIGLFPYYQPAGQYLLFLHQAIGHGAIAEPAEGMKGMFHLEGQTVDLRCLVNEPVPVEASGSAPTLAALIAEIPQLLPQFTPSPAPAP